MKWVPRSQWGARQARGRPSLSSPQGETFHYVAGPRMGSFPHASCATRVRNIQNFHMDSRGWVDIAYNTLTCPHGYVYEGRGWFIRSAANGTNIGNASSYANCHLAGVGDVLTEDGKQAMRDALQAARTIGRAGSRVWVHNDWKNTGCPGDEISRFVRSGLAGSAPAPTPQPSTQEDDMRIIRTNDGHYHCQWGTGLLTPPGEGPKGLPVWELDKGASDDAYALNHTYRQSIGR